MISAIIVWGSLLGAVLFTVAYLFSPSLRAQVEQPKHSFHKQVQDFDADAGQAPESERGRNE